MPNLERQRPDLSGQRHALPGHFPMNADLAGILPQLSAQHGNGCAFSGAVYPQKCKQLSGLYLKREVVYCVNISKSFLQMCDFNTWFHLSSPPFRSYGFIISHLSPIFKRNPVSGIFLCVTCTFHDKSDRDISQSLCSMYAISFLFLLSVV